MPLVRCSREIWPALKHPSCPRLKRHRLLLTVSKRPGKLKWPACWAREDCWKKGEARCWTGRWRWAAHWLWKADARAR